MRQFPNIVSHCSTAAGAEHVVRAAHLAQRRRRLGRIQVPGVQHRVVGHDRELLGEALVQRFGIAAGKVGAAAAVEEQRVARDEPTVDEEALRAGRVTRACG